MSVSGAILSVDGSLSDIEHRYIVISLKIIQLGGKFESAPGRGRFWA